MTIIDYYNYFAVALYIIIVAVAVFLSVKKNRNSADSIGDGLTYVLFGVIILVSAIIRIFLLDRIPYGLQQDEASIGYEAYCLANYGIDRNGYSWPIYPITWGCGGGSPLLIYLNVISVSLFGTGIIKLRLIPAICGVLTVILFFFTLRLVLENKRFRNEVSLLGTTFLAICPWHVILSRWSLDANIMPFNILLAVYLFLLGIKKRSTFIYCLSSAAFAVCMYSYGAATVVVPIFLVLMCIYCLRRQMLSLGQLIAAVITFIVLFSPLLVFYLINYVGIPEIITPFVSFNKFTAARTGEAFVSFDGNFFRNIAENLRSLLLVMSIGDSSHTLVHFYPGYAALYVFTFPVTLLGFVFCIKEIVTVRLSIKTNGQEEVVRLVNDEISRKKNAKGEEMFKAGNFAFLALALSNALLIMVIIPDTSRMVMAFIPFIYFFVKGTEYIINSSKVLYLGLVTILIVAALSFSKDYFKSYNKWAESIFMPGYGEAIERAYEIAGDEKEILSTYEGLSAPFMLALYYNNYDPHKFYTTVKYKDPEAEFRIAESFGNFTFGLPENINYNNYKDSILVLGSSDLHTFKEKQDKNKDTDEVEGYTIESFGGYHVVYKTPAQN